MPIVARQLNNDTAKRLSAESGQNVKHSHPLMTTRAALPMTLNDAFTAIFGDSRPYRGKAFAHRAKPAANIAIIVVRGLWAPIPTVVRPAVLDFVGGRNLRHGNLLAL